MGQGEWCKNCSLRPEMWSRKCSFMKLTVLPTCTRLIPTCPLFFPTHRRTLNVYWIIIKKMNRLSADLWRSTDWRIFRRLRHKDSDWVAIHFIKVNLGRCSHWLHRIRLGKMFTLISGRKPLHQSQFGEMFTLTWENVHADFWLQTSSSKSIWEDVHTDFIKTDLGKCSRWFLVANLFINLRSGRVNLRPEGLLWSLKWQFGGLGRLIWGLWGSIWGQISAWEGWFKAWLNASGRGDVQW